MQRPCITCGTVIAKGSYCAHHDPRAGYTTAERKRRAQVVNRHRALYGQWCPGWRRPPHQTSPSNPLTFDHLVAIANGGREDGPGRVLCRSCNSSRGARA